MPRDAKLINATCGLLNSKIRDRIPNSQDGDLHVQWACQTSSSVQCKRTLKKIQYFDWKFVYRANKSCKKILGRKPILRRITSRTPHPSNIFSVVVASLRPIRLYYFYYFPPNSRELIYTEERRTKTVFWTVEYLLESTLVSY